MPKGGDFGRKMKKLKTQTDIELEDTIWGDPPNGVILGEPACQ